MAAITKDEVQTIADESTCILCVSDKQLMALIVWLLWDSLNPDTPMTKDEVQTLVDDATCITECMSHKQILGAIAYLLFAGGGGGGGGSTSFTTGHGSPEGSVTGSPGARYVDLDTGFFYTKVTGTGNTGWQVGA